MDDKTADHTADARLDAEVMDSVTTSSRRRRRSLSLALPVLGLSALVLAGCGEAEEAAQGGSDAVQEQADGDDSSQEGSGGESEDGSDAQTEEGSDAESEDGSDAASSGASQSASDSASGEPSESASASSSASGSAGGAAAIPSERAELDEIVSAAEGTLDGSSAVSIDDEDGGGWEVTVVAGQTEQEVHVSEDHQAEVQESESDDIEIDPSTLQTSLADAVETAAGEQDGSVTQVDLDDDDDRAVWQVEFDDDIDVDVAADSGEVVGTDS